MTISPLAEDYYPAKYYYKNPRKRAVDWIMIHCTVGRCTAKSLAAVWAVKPASSNYGVGYDGSVGCYVLEEHGAYCCSYSTDDRAISIETSSANRYPYETTEEAIDALVELCADICYRYDKRRFVWFGNKAETDRYTPAHDEMVLSVHRWYAAKSCPGEYIYNRLGEVVSRVNERLEEMFMVRYSTISEVPAWGQETVKKLCNVGAIKGRGGEPDGDGYPTDLDLSEDMLRTLVMLDRAGVFAANGPTVRTEAETERLMPEAWY